MMDKSWIHLSAKSSVQYLVGCGSFLDFAFSNNNGLNVIQCPCTKCMNRYYHNRLQVLDHLLWNGFDTSYDIWTRHGESVSSSTAGENIGSRGSQFDDEMINMLNDVFDHQDMDEGSGAKDMDKETSEFYKLLDDAEKELYPGCEKFSTLSFTVRLLHLKVLYGWSDKSFNELLRLLKEVLPPGETLPKSYYYAKKFFRSLGFNYQKIDACPKDCMLFWKEKEGLEACDVYGADRYEYIEKDDEEGKTKRKRKAIKRMRYFPLKPRLRRLFMSSKTVSLLKWHKEERVDDGVMRHPADTPAWKSLDERDTEFAKDSRNIRLGLAADGFSPFRTIGIPHSTWPVVLIIYNYEPRLLMKSSSYMLSILIDGPQSPGNDIDVYLQPLIEDLNEAWTIGITTVDAITKNEFQLRAALLWTINDFPAYAMLSGWSTKGALACPNCNKDTDSVWLKHCRKFCYAGHRRFLDADHKFRRDATNFYDKRESRPSPTTLSGDEIYRQVENIENKFGKQDETQKRKRSAISSNTSACIPTYSWKKKSIFFELPYWSGHLIRHNLDVMHNEKNLLESVLHTLLDDKRKSKDGLNARKDLKHIGIRKSLHPVPSGGGKYQFAPAPFTMTSDEKTTFCKVIKSVKVPDNYSSNISKCVKVKEKTIFGLKSHDCHVLMQQILPVAIRRTLPSNAAKILMDLCNFFRRLCEKELHPSDIAEIQERIKVTLCEMEKMFPPSFFDIMAHLPIHLAEEASVAGPVWTRWMYGVERYLVTLKQYVRQRNYPEGSIAEGYLAEECLAFCSRYLDEDVETKLNRPARYTEGGNGKQIKFILSEIEKQQAHRYVLFNTSSVDQFREMHIQHLKRTSTRKLAPHAIDKKHNEEFPKWLKDYVRQTIGDNNIPEEVKILSGGPSMYSIRYKKGYTINGLKFHTVSYAANKKSQNTGVTLRADTQSYSTVKDKRPVTGPVSYYGKLRDVIELRYSMDVKFDLFRCDWVNPTLGQKVDKFNFTLVNFKHLLYRENIASDEPFIFASQAEQVWYVPDPIEPEWNVAVIMKPRGAFNMSTFATCPQAEPYGFQEMNSTEETDNAGDGFVRTDAPAIIVVDNDSIDAGNDDANDDEGYGYNDAEGEDIYGDDDDDADDTDDDDDDEDGDEGDEWI